VSAHANGKVTDAIAQRVNGTLRKGILAAARSQRMGSAVRKHGMRLGAQRFVAGETFAEAAEVLARLNASGLHANTTLLGEDVLSVDEAHSVTAEYVQILDGIAERGLRANVALKLTHLGLLLDEELAYENVRQLVDHAAGLGTFIRLDMESSGLVDQTLDIYRRLRGEGREAVGTVLQAYLRAISNRSSHWIPSRTCGSSRARTSSRPRSPTRARPMSIPPTAASSRPRWREAHTPQSRRMTSA
jgi:proline dehydrogenase